MGKGAFEILEVIRMSILVKRLLKTSLVTLAVNSTLMSPSFAMSLSEAQQQADSYGTYPAEQYVHTHLPDNAEISSYSIIKTNNDTYVSVSWYMPGTEEDGDFVVNSSGIIVDIDDISDDGLLSEMGELCDTETSICISDDLKEALDGNTNDEPIDVILHLQFAQDTQSYDGINASIDQDQNVTINGKSSTMKKYLEALDKIEKKKQIYLNKEIQRTYKALLKGDINFSSENKKRINKSKAQKLPSVILKLSKDEIVSMRLSGSINGLLSLHEDAEKKSAMDI